MSDAVAHDFDKDGHIDVISSYDGKIILYQGLDWKPHVIVEELPLNPDTGGELRGCLHSTIMDVDGDGYMDFVGCRVLGKGVIWLKGPEFSQIEIDADIKSPHSLAVANMTGNGFLDIICGEASPDADTVIYLNDGKEVERLTILP